MRITTHPSSTRLPLIAAFTGLTLLSACALDDTDLEEDADTESSLAGNGNIVTTWAGIAADAIMRPDEASTALRTPGPSTMLMAQVQLAVYDAMVAIEEDYKPFSYRKGWSGSINAEAAVATAAYRVLRTRVPGRADFLDAQYAATMGAISGGHSKTKGTSLGEAVAAHYLVLRANDNIDNNYTWNQPPTGPGVFEPVAPAQPVDYKMVFVKPITFSSHQTSWFFPPPPPSLTSSTYTTTWHETRNVGGANSTVRTEAQKQLALWSGEHPFRWASRNLNELAVAKNLSRMKAARFFALTFTSMADTFQTGMSAKYHYNYWRPFHSIPRADTDGNSATPADPSWTPLLNVNHPEYPAGHGLIGAGSFVESVRAFFGTNSVSWTLTTVGVTGLTQTARSYTSLNALAQDMKNARVYAGLHYRFSVDAGQAQGKAVVNYINSRFFKRD